MMEKRKRLGMAMTLIRLTTGIQTKRRVDPQRKIWRRPEITISRSWRRMRRMMTRARKTKVRMQMSPTLPPILPGAEEEGDLGH